MAVINKRFKYIFLAEPRTASRSTARALALQKGSKEAGAHHIQIEPLIKYGFLKLEHRKRYTTFCTVRNPCDMLVTLWMGLNGSWNFSRYLQKCLTQASDNFFFQHANRVDCVIHYENLQQELNDFLRGRGAPTVELPHIGKTEGKTHWSDYYDFRELREMIVCFPEIVRWGYDKIIEQIMDQKIKQNFAKNT